MRDWLPRHVDGVVPSAVAVLASAVGILGCERLFASVGPGARAPDPAALPWLFAGAMIMTAMAGIVSALVSLPAFLVARSRRRELFAASLSGLAMAAIAYVPARLTAVALISGDWIARQDWAPQLGWALSLAIPLGVALVAALDAWIGATSERPRWLRNAVSVVIAAIAVGGLAADAYVMPSLHREFHLLVFGISTICGYLVSRRLLQRLPRNRLTRSLAAAALLLAVAAPIAWAQMSSAARGAVVLDSRTAAGYLRVLSRPVPNKLLAQELARLESEPPLLARDTTRKPEHQVTPPGGGEWNVVLIVVDTLRADALPPVRRDGRRSAEDGDSPFLDQWISQSFRFRASYAQASRTKRSMPALFRSLRAYEHPHKNGRPLGETMGELGRTPVAVVPNILFERREARANQLLNGFERVVTYDKPEMHAQHGQTEQLLAQVKGQPFFAWLHYYGMHMPGYDGHTLKKTDGTWPERYRMSLRWLDGELAKLMATLDELGVRDETIVILVADHGEGLGANGVNQHGPTVFEEETRTPLFVHIPGREGREIDALVGNVDVVPTIFELLGHTPDARHQGRSLVPLFFDDDAADDWDHHYYIESGNGMIVGIVHGTDKLIYDIEAGVFHRFDVEADPLEDHDLHGVDPTRDRELKRRLMYSHPKLFTRELESPDTLALLQARMAEQDAEAPSEALEFLAAVAATAQDEQTLAEAHRLFRETPDDSVRLVLLRHMQRRNPRSWTKAVVDRLKEIQGTRAELEFVDGLARQDQPKFDPRYAGKRLARWGKRDDVDSWKPWLRLTHRWSGKSPQHFAQPLALMLERTPADRSDVLPLILGNLASMRRVPKRVPKGLGERVAELLDHDVALVRVSATRALGRVGGDAQVARLERAAAEDALEVRQAALWALSEVQGGDAIPTVVAHARNDDLFSVAAIDILSKLGDERGLEYLDETAEGHYNGIVRNRAKRAAQKVRKQASRKSGSRTGRGRPPKQPPGR